MNQRVRVRAKPQPVGSPLTGAILTKRFPVVRITLARLMLAIGLLAGGCTGVVPAALRAQVEPRLSLQNLQANPQEYRGRMVLLGGEILEIQAGADEAMLVVLHRPLEALDRPLLTGRSEGRFWVRLRAPLPRGYREGQPMTVVGEVSGEARPAYTGKDLHAPVLDARYVHLWSSADYAQTPVFRSPLFGSPFLHPHRFHPFVRMRALCD